MDQNTTHIEWVLDRSGSMLDLVTDVIGGFNGFVEDQKKIPGRCTVTLTTFADTSSPVHENMPLVEMPALTPATYRPGGNTALLDAACSAIDKLGKRLDGLPENKRPGKVIFVIQTDGLENASRVFKQSDLKSRIEHQREKYGWQFVFLGADQDAIANAANYGIPAFAALSYANTAAGNAQTYAVASAAVSRVRTWGGKIHLTDPAKP